MMYSRDDGNKRTASSTPFRFQPRIPVTHGDSLSYVSPCRDHYRRISRVESSARCQPGVMQLAAPGMSDRQTAGVRSAACMFAEEGVQQVLPQMRDGSPSAPTPMLVQDGLGQLLALVLGGPAGESGAWMMNEPA